MESQVQLSILRRIDSGCLFAVLAGVLAVTPNAVATDNPARLTETLHKLDVASAKFQSAQADFKKDLYERVVKETTTQSGTIYFVRKGPATQMGAKFVTPAPKVIEFKDGMLKLYDPGTNHLQPYASGDNRAKFESFLTLGFGGSGQDLQKAWTIDDQGTEAVSDGSSTKNAEKLVLVPKDSSVKSTINQVTLWVDLDRGLSLKQEFIFPSGDKQTAFYSNIKYNQKVDLKPFEIKCKGSCS
jgi:outer membrane lipoprotein-sorting protein